MNDVRYCEHCGGEVRPTADVCINCGKFIKNSSTPIENAPSDLYEDTPRSKNIILNIVFFVILFFFQMLYYTVIMYTLRDYVGIKFDELSLSSFQIISIAIDFSLMIALFFIFKKSIVNGFRNYNKKDFLFGLKYWVIGLGIMIATNLVISFFYSGNASNEIIVQELFNDTPYFALFSATLYAPFVEELIYRKAVRNFIKNGPLYIIISGLLFGTLHVIGGTDNNLEYLYIISYGALGSIFAYIYAKTKNITIPITFHFIHNAIAAFVTLLGMFLE